MAGKIMTNKDKNLLFKHLHLVDAYRVDVIDKGGLKSHYFNTEKEAKEFKLKRIKFRSVYINKRHLAMYKQI